jgi:ABC-type molybdate transport system substrate-binding protein
MDADAAPVRVFAAGSLKTAFIELGGAMAAAGCPSVEWTFGAAGLLLDRVRAGAACDVFASSDLARPRSVARDDTVHNLARNRLCALTRAELGITTENLLSRMLDPSLRLGMSTPGADPSGDYALAVFAAAADLVPGADSALRAKAAALTGGNMRRPSPQRRRHGTYATIMLERRADIFITYLSSARAAMRESPALAMVRLPAAMEIVAEYGLAEVTDRPGTETVTAWIRSDRCAEMLVARGFERAP